MSRLISTRDLHNVVTRRKMEYGKLATLVDNIVEEMVGETPTANAIEREKYDLLKRQLADSWNRIDELDKLNGHMQDKINLAIESMKKLQEIEQIIKQHDEDRMPEDFFYIDKIREVINNENK